MSYQDERDLTPRPNPIVNEPATPAACQGDYDQAGDVRARLGWKDGQS